MSTPSIQRNRGFALITVLILLVIMLIGGMALFRNSDTAALLAGNAAAKQAASQAGNVGLVAAQKILEGTIPTTNGNGFSTQALSVDSYGVPTTTSSVTWYPTTPVDVNTDSGYTYQYIIEKLCNASGVCTQSTSSGTVTQTSLAPNAVLPSKSSAAVALYRVTVKVNGPRSVTSYVQAIYGI